MTTDFLLTGIISAALAVTTYGLYASGDFKAIIKVFSIEFFFESKKRQKRCRRRKPR